MNPIANSLRYVIFATDVAAIGGFLFGYDTAVINGANTYLKAAFQLTPAQEGIAGASAILGCIPGAMFAGSLSDRYGRRKLLFFCAILFAVSGLLSAVPRTFTGFLAARFIRGLGIGAASMICPVYIAEIAPEKWRGRLGTLFQLGIVTGILLRACLNIAGRQGPTSGRSARRSCERPDMSWFSSIFMNSCVLISFAGPLRRTVPAIFTNESTIVRTLA